MTAGFLPRSVSRNGETYRYQIYTPSGCDNTEQLPTVLYLHGKGRGGRDGAQQIEGGLAEAIRLKPESFPLIAIFPQSPNDSEFVGDIQDLVLQILTTTLETEPVDRDRLYLIGSSMGGHGVYHLAQQHRDLFAAYVVSCGSPCLPKSRREALGRAPEGNEQGVLTDIAARLVGLPGWIFHGAEDEVVPVTNARRMVAALRAAGAEIHYTEYGEGGHELCSQPYRDERLWSWLLTQQRA